MKKFSSLFRKSSPGPSSGGSPGQPGRPPYRWTRRDAPDVITLDAALQLIDGHEPQGVLEQKRLASEQRARDLEQTVSELRRKVSHLESTLEVVTTRARHLEQSRGTPRPGPSRTAKQPSPADDGRGSLYARIGLTADCPTYVLEAARKAYAVKFHPDQYQSASEKERATADFQYYMRIFDILLARRR
jgi:hypothetical protein